MSEIHPHDALLELLNEEQFGSQKAYGMWGGCNWHFIDADPQALVIQVVAKENPLRFAHNIAEAVIRDYRNQLDTAVVRTWSRLSGSEDEPVLEEFAFGFEEDPIVERKRSAVLWERCAEIGWERGERARSRPAAAPAQRVVNVVAAPPALPKPHAEMTPDDVQRWAHDWAVAIVGEISDQL